MIVGLLLRNWESIWSRVFDAFISLYDSTIWHVTIVQWARTPAVSPFIKTSIVFDMIIIESHGASNC